MEKKTDEQIIQIINKQNRKSETAFAELMKRYAERLYWHVRKIVINHDSADDVAQNTWLKVFQNLSSFRSDSKFFTWLYRIGTNEALSYLQKEKRNTAEDYGDYENHLSNTLESDHWFEGDEIQKRLQQAILKLPEKQRLVFNMKYFDEMKYQEMADVLETSVGALKASYHHAVKKIEEFLKIEIL
jgi:RNA polymerase sigma-70 factor (ECF subfamily)